LRRWGWSIVPALAGLGLVAWNLLGIHAASWQRSLNNAHRFARETIPPDWSVLQVGLAGLWETLLIAYLATLIGLALSLPLAILAARNLVPLVLSIPVRVVLAAIRVMPAILWAILFVLILGPGALAGVLAMTFYTIGFLGKLQYEAIEGLPAVPLEAATAMGLKRWQRVNFVVVPEAANALISQALFMFEYNVRASTIIGIVGAGGIGFYIGLYLEFWQYDRVLALLALVFMAVLLIDAVSGLIRRSFMESPPGARRATWRDVISLRPPRPGM
jgi:phosphonate transport system permease protein